mmetsp:Transcript_3354/g.9550  ORF Transcript_3354/g.9550 Transcript_3354/m.9550 type:complete len:221 (+) Transcript_3354:66-728(+)
MSEECHCHYISYRVVVFFSCKYSSGCLLSFQDTSELSFRFLVSSLFFIIGTLGDAVQLEAVLDLWIGISVRGVAAFRDFGDVQGDAEAVVGDPDLDHGDLGFGRAHGSVGEGFALLHVLVGVADLVAGDVLVEEDVHEVDALRVLLSDAEGDVGSALLEDDDGGFAVIDPVGVADLHEELQVFWALVRRGRHGWRARLGRRCSGERGRRLALIRNVNVRR